jgi:hypothetical protein
MLEKITIYNCKTLCLAFLGLLLASPVMAQDKPEIKLVEHCVTIIICLFGKKVRKTRWRFGYDVFRVNAKGAYKGIL